MSNKGSCLVVDDEAIFAEVVRHALHGAGIARVQRVPLSANVVEVARRERPSLVLVDVDPSDAASLEIAASLAAVHPAPRVVAVTETSERRAVEAVRRGGFWSHLTKDGSVDGLAGSLLAIVSGRRVGPDPVDDPSPLSSRQRTVLDLLVRGATDAAVARELGISPHTVRSHVRDISRKLDVHTRVEAAVVAMRRGLM